MKNNQFELCKLISLVSDRKSQTMTFAFLILFNSFLTLTLLQWKNRSVCRQLKNLKKCFRDATCQIKTNSIQLHLN